jgi:hypothetical protein
MDPDYPAQLPQPPPYYYPPQSAPLAGYQQPYGPPQPQVINKPGGLSSAAHIGHIIASIMTCGTWLPFYLLFVLFAPTRRAEVIVPLGADPQAVAAAYATAAPSVAERRARNQTAGALLAAIFLIVLACTLIAWLG